MMCKDIIAFYYENHTEHINELCGHYTNLYNANVVHTLTALLRRISGDITYHHFTMPCS